MTRRSRIIGTDRRIRLGIWGLGRGMSFYNMCAALNIDVVAGCDFNAHMRDQFRAALPDALVTADEREFLAADIDAVLLATYCPAHGPDALKCLAAGKHVLSEVTAFATPSQGVALVEAVERSGLVYNMAENYPYTRANLWLADQWRRGLFGALQYAEYEYVHELRTLAYTWIDGTPLVPGWAVHHWRSWFNFHLYNTHSLGPVMHITGERPVRVAALPAGTRLPGTLATDPMATPGAMTPSLITMSGGGLMRNLMGMSTSDTHAQRLWGTRGSAESGEHGVFVRLGGSGESPRLRVKPAWPDLAGLADSMGHGGGDFWVLYHFARHVLLGQPAFFDAYRSADCTLPGILAYRSALADGAPQDVPDFRRKRDRDAFRRDHRTQPPLDITGVFPASADRRLTGAFTGIMKALSADAPLCRGTADWLRVADIVDDAPAVVRLADAFLAGVPRMRALFARARTLARAYPRSTGARVINEMLDLAGGHGAVSPSFVRTVRRARNRLARRR